MKLRSVFLLSVLLSFTMLAACGNEESSIADTTAPTVSHTEATTPTTADSVTTVPAATEPATTTTAATEPITDISTETTPSTSASDITDVPATSEPVVTPPPEPVEEDVYAPIGCDKGDVEYFIKSAESVIDIPVIHIATENREEIISLEEYKTCIVDVFNCDEKYVISGAEAGVRVRGNSTAYYGDVNQILRNQVPYRIKFESKRGMLGLNDEAECKNWVLLKAEWNLIMDYTAFQMAERIIENYSSDSEIVLVYVNQKFKGVYILCEQNQVNENRVDVTEVPKDYKGTDIGYFLELNNYAEGDEDPYIRLDYEWATVTDIEGTARQFVPAEYSIKNDTYSQAQIDFISKYLNGVFKIVLNACEYDNYLTFDSNYNVVSSAYTNAYDCISAVADIDSIVNMYILYEMVHDNDCGEGSFYMCVDFSENSKYPKLTFICPWDFNWAYGGDAQGRYYAAAFNDRSFVNEFGDRTNPWFVVLNTEQWFVDMVKERWQELGGKNMISQVVNEIYEKVNANRDDYNRSSEYAVDCAIELLRWVSNRAEWLNGQWA